MRQKAECPSAQEALELNKLQQDDTRRGVTFKCRLPKGTLLLREADSDGPPSKRKLPTRAGAEQISTR